MKMAKITAVVMSVVMLLACTAFSASAATNVNLTELTPGFINLTMTPDGLGATMEGPWTTAEGFGYTYWNLPWDSFVNTPYLVLDIADDSLASVGGWCALSNGWLGSHYQDLKVADKQVIDLRTLVSEGEANMCLCITYEGNVTFDALYLTDDPDASAGGNTETGVESAVAVAAAAVIGAASLMVVSRKK